MNCRYCKKDLEHELLDLGNSPPSNAYLTYSQLSEPETYHPLSIFMCSKCGLVQTGENIDSAELFNDAYAYFSSTSDSWLSHCEQYVDEIIERLGLISTSRVVEIASNDGYLLKFFQKRRIEILGVEPTLSTALVSQKSGIPTLNTFFTRNLAIQIVKDYGKADLVIGNNVYAHVPDIRDFTKGISDLLKPNGTVTLEFPSLSSLVVNCQFDTIYHEHYSYLSLTVVQKIFAENGLRLYDAEKIKTHGGSYRVYGCLKHSPIETTASIDRLLTEENSVGLNTLDVYKDFQEKITKQQIWLLNFLLQCKHKGESVFGFGAAAKANTFLNSSGIKHFLLPGIFDSAKSKQGLYMPGSHIPILSPENIDSYAPDFLIVFPWNIFDEIHQKYSYLTEKYGTILINLNTISQRSL